MKQRVLWLTGVGHASSHCWELIFPAVSIPMAREMGIPLADAISLGFILYLFFGLGAPLAGWLSDRIGARRVLLACLLGGGSAGLLVASSTSVVGLQASLGLLGLAASLYHPSGLALLSVHFPDRMGRAFAINGMAGNLGIALTPFLAGLSASVVGWRSTYAVLCGPALAIGLLLIFMPFPDAPASGHAKSQQTEQMKDFRYGPALAFAIAIMAGGLAYRLHTLVVPALIQERLPQLGQWIDFAWLQHTDNLAATFVTSIAYLMGLFGQWLGGRVADRYRLPNAYLGFHLVAAPLLVSAAFFGGWWFVVFLLAFLFFAIGMQPVENALVASLVPPAFRGRAYAGKFILTFGVGSLGAYVVGWLVPWGGLTASLYAGFALEVVLIAAAFVMLRLTTKASAR